MNSNSWFKMFHSKKKKQQKGKKKLTISFFPKLFHIAELFSYKQTQQRPVLGRKYSVRY